MAGGNPLTRRTLCIGVGATVAMAGLGALRYVGSEPLVRPPGGQPSVPLRALLPLHRSMP